MLVVSFKLYETEDEFEDSRKFEQLMAMGADAIEVEEIPESQIAPNATPRRKKKL